MSNLDRFLPAECNLFPNVKGNFKNRLWCRQNLFEMTCTDSKYVHGLHYIRLRGSVALHILTSRIKIGIEL